MKQEDYFKTCDDSVLVSNRADLQARIAIERAKAKQEQDESLIRELETRIESISYYLDNRAILSAMSMVASGIQPNPKMYPAFSQAMSGTSSQFAEIAASVGSTLGLPQLGMSSSTTRNENKSTRSVASSASKTVIDATEMNHTEAEILQFLCDSGNGAAELFAFVNKLRDYTLFHGMSTHVVLVKGVGAIAISEKAPKDNVYNALVKELVSPLVNGDSHPEALPLAAFRLAFEMNVHSSQAYDILLDMIVQYSQLIGKDEASRVSLQKKCWDSFVFDPQRAIASPQLRGYYTAAKFDNDSDILKDLADISNELAKQILTDMEIDDLRKAKNILFNVAEATNVPQTVKDLSKETPITKEEGAAKAKSTNKKKKKR